MNVRKSLNDGQQVDSLQEKVMNLEIQLKNSKYALSGTLEAPDTMKSIQHGGFYS